jgi:hypothetical protein
MGHMLCFCPMGFSVSPATVLRGGEDSLSYRLQLRFKKCTSEGDLHKPSLALNWSSLQTHNTDLLTAKLKLYQMNIARESLYATDFAKFTCISAERLL